MTPVKLRDATRKMCEQTSDSCITKFPCFFALDTGGIPETASLQ